MNLPDWHFYESLGQNPREVPQGEWERVYVSGTGNTETWADHSQRLTYQIICD